MSLHRSLHLLWGIFYSIFNKKFILICKRSKHYQDKLLAKQKGLENHDKPILLPDDQARYSIELDDQFGDIEETLMKVTGTHIRYRIFIDFQNLN